MRVFGSSTLSILPLVTAAVLLGLTLPPAATAYIQEVAVVPPQPSRCDSVSFDVAGYFPDGCWSYDGYDLEILPTEGPFTVFRMRVFCSREEGFACPTVIIPYEISHGLGALSSGPYTLMVVEADSRDSTVFYDQESISFTVRESCDPVESCVMPGFAPGQHRCNATVFPGSPGFLTVTLANSMPIAGAEMVVEPFQQFRGENCEPGTRCGFTIRVSGVEPVARASGMGVDWTFDGSTLHFMLYPLQVPGSYETYGFELIEPGDGPIAKIWIEVVVDSLVWAHTIPELMFDVVLDPVAFADENGRSVAACPTFGPITGTVCIRNPLKCDVNGDGRRDVVDIVRMIRCIMCPIPEGCCTPDEAARADCNGDNVLNVTDVVCCIRSILDSFCYWCEDGQARSSELSNAPVTLGLSGDVFWNAGDRFTVPLVFSSSVDVGGVEARIQYDESVLRVKDVVLSEALEGAELFFSSSDGILSLMVVDVEGGRLPAGDGRLGEISFFSMLGEGQETELLLREAACADVEGARVEVVLSGERVLVKTPSVPAVRLTSRPNPFHSCADISLSITTGQRGRLAVYDVAGRLVRTLHKGNLPAGVTAFSWDGRSDEGLEVRTGVYFLRFEGEKEGLAGKLVLLRR